MALAYKHKSVQLDVCHLLGAKEVNFYSNSTIFYYFWYFWFVLPRAVNITGVKTKSKKNKVWSD